MFLKSFLVFLISSVSMAGVVTVDTSVKCRVTDTEAPIQSFNFDLYATGFPMAGVAMFSGMFEADTPGLNSRKTRGHIYTSVLNGNLFHTANSNSLENINYELKVGTDGYKAGEIYTGELTLKIEGLLAPSDDTTYNVSCKLK
jgi:hypothetical protein